MICHLRPVFLAAIAAGVLASVKASADENPNVAVTVRADDATKISSDLIGIFFEDINYSADGGLYAELVQNRSFEYSRADKPGWNSLTSWELVTGVDGQGSVTVTNEAPLNPNNPHYAVLDVVSPGGGVGLANSGFDGITLKKGEEYDLSFFARKIAGDPASITVRLEGRTGAVYGQVTGLPELRSEWGKYTAKIHSTSDDADARLVLLAHHAGTYCFDTISLFPHHTFHERANGLRADLAEAIAELHPKFMRFPGGCVAHGRGLKNIYRWKDTIGPIEQRKEQENLWGYHQSVGLGYFEYLQFCEDIGAKALPVQAAGVCCQNSPGGQHGVPMDQMDEVIQDILDLIEYANGPTNSLWGAKRAATGHPAPFHLEYVGIGNEDQQTPTFGVRFKAIYEGVKAKHPEITIIGTVGPSPAGSDYAEGWKFARELGVDMVDEHYYEVPNWFLANLHRYDNYNSAGTKVYVGEYASWGNRLSNAIAEAAYLTSLERNGDVVHMASYAPLLGRENHMQWSPDLIYFNNSTVCPSVNYYVQQMFSRNDGDAYLSTEVTASDAARNQTGFMLGTWDTQAEFKDLKVVSGQRNLIDEPWKDAANWSGDAAAWTVAGGSYVQRRDGQPVLSELKTRINATDYVLTLKARKTAGREGFLIGFAARDPRNCYWWNLGGWDNTQHGIEKISNGNKTSLGTAVDGSIQTGRWYDIKIEVGHGRIKCYLDGVLVQSVAETIDVGPADVVASSVRDTKNGDLIVKLVNVSARAIQSSVNITGAEPLQAKAVKTVLTGDPAAEDTFQNPARVVPVASEINAGASFTADLPAHSLAVIRLKSGRNMNVVEK